MRSGACWAVVCWWSGLALAGAQPGGPPAKESAYEQVVTQTLAALDQMTKALAPVKDEAGAEAARPNLKQAAALFLAARKKAEQMKQPDQKQKDLITDKYQKKLADAVQHLRTEIRRVQDVAGGPNLLKELDEVLKPSKKK